MRCNVHSHHPQCYKVKEEHNAFPFIFLVPRGSSKAKKGEASQARAETKSGKGDRTKLPPHYEAGGEA
jgi:hypothetical protein